MSEHTSGLWGLSKGLARSVLRERGRRRRLLLRLLLVVLVFFALGLWGVDDWLEGGVMRFGLWWLGCAGLTVALMVLALYDALAVVREERAALRGDKGHGKDGDD
jgi:hypothetical protein